MKNTDVTFFDNTNDYSKYDDAKQTVYESFRDGQEWSNINDVPADMVWDEISAQNEADWEYFSSAMKREIYGHSFLIMGTCGRWNGPRACGNFIFDWNDFRSFIRHLDTLKIYERNGHLFIEGCHHDGQDSYELKRLTSKGIEYAASRHFAHDKTLHEKIMNTNFFSALPRLADVIFGTIKKGNSARDSAGVSVSGYPAFSFICK